MVVSNENNCQNQNYFDQNMSKTIRFGHMSGLRFSQGSNKNIFFSKSQFCSLKFIFTHFIIYKSNWLEQQEARLRHFIWFREKWQISHISLPVALINAGQKIRNVLKLTSYVRHRVDPMKREHSCGHKVKIFSFCVFCHLDLAFDLLKGGHPHVFFKNDSIDGDSVICSLKLKITVCCHFQSTCLNAHSPNFFWWCCCLQTTFWGNFLGVNLFLRHLTYLENATQKNVVQSVC